MLASQLRKKFTDFFVDRGHHLLPSASLIPENDPSALFINSGMHPLVPYLMGQPHSEGKRLTSVQKCIRTDDIDEVGDSFHHTFFEMLGNWSLGDYFKKEAIGFSWQFLTQELNLDTKRLLVTVFAGDKDAPKDEQAAQIWQQVGIPKSKIYYLPKQDNWWAVGPTGPCGPDSEVFYDVQPDKKPCSSRCRPGCSCGKYREIWNNVFMVYNRKQDNSLEELPQKNVDTGLGLERTITVLQGKTDHYQTELFSPLIQLIEELLGEKYSSNKRSMRIIADHLRTATFIINDGIEPSNKQQGYILRRLIRRAAVKIYQFSGKLPSVKAIQTICNQVTKDYQKLYFNKKSQLLISRVIEQEVTRFNCSLDRGIKLIAKQTSGEITGEFVFDLFQTHGFPFEITQEIVDQKGFKISKKDFDKRFQKHQQLSRIASVGMFKGGLKDQSENTTKLHTVTHLLHQALRQVLGDHVHQEGSNITAVRLRFDFSHSQALNDEEIKKIENLVNQKIKKDLPVKKAIVVKDKAIQSGALAFFKTTYSNKVTVYSIGDFSKEICGGPHVSSTGEIQGVRIVKEQSCGAGKRRIYAVLDDGTQKSAHQV